MTIPDLEPVDLDDPDLDDLMHRHDEQVAALLRRREQLAFQLRHWGEEDFTNDGWAELALVDEELAALGVSQA